MKVVIIGAAGRDFHDFNVYFKKNKHFAKRHRHQRLAMHKKHRKHMAAHKTHRHVKHVRKHRKHVARNS